MQSSQMTPPRKPVARATVFDPSLWFVHQSWGGTAKIIESDCVVCRLSVGAATHKRAMDAMELAHVTVEHPRGLLRWFLHTQQSPAA
jgi:hypothetical protein